ncbi:hypothetical protein C8R44DRAFT_989381 [Mycena epipterygia]|nr:hypothetical protein C8R44DRAFT_989381 [Mycena epipterygia]
MRVGVLQENQRILQSLFSPIRKLPPEILRLVLELSAGANHFKEDGKSVSGGTRVSSVCYHWRMIALSTPRIWATFIVDFVARAQNTSMGFVSAIERHLRLAGDAELELDLRAPESVVVDHEVLELFATHASRWRSATFKLESITPRAREILETALDKMPSLESLHIHRLFKSSNSSAINIGFFKSCPALRNLSLVEYNPTAASTIPWAQLTSIHFAPSDAGIINTVLDRCPSLVSVSLSVPTSYNLERVNDAIDPRILQLQTLRIESRYLTGYRALSGILTVCRGMTLPALTSLTIVSTLRRKTRASDESRFEERTWPQEAVVSMLTRSACKLRILRLQGIPLDTSQALQLLRLAPHAVEVALHECKTPNVESISERRLWAILDDLTANHFVTPAFLAALSASASASDAPLLPRLRRLELVVNGTFAMDAYVAMVRSRWPGPTGPRLLETGVDRLNSISLKAIEDEDDGVYWNSESVLALKKEGLAVRYDDGQDYYDYNTPLKSRRGGDSDYSSE